MANSQEQGDRGYDRRRGCSVFCEVDMIGPCHSNGECQKIYWKPVLLNEVGGDGFRISEDDDQKLETGCIG